MLSDKRRMSKLIAPAFNSLRRLNYWNGVRADKTLLDHPPGFVP
jgi:hypothetical protein